MDFAKVFSNDFVEVRVSTLPLRDVAVLCVFGNTAAYESVWNEWPDSCAWHAHVIINVKESHLEHALYLRGDRDDEHTHKDDFTGSDVAHTEEVVRGVFQALVRHIRSTKWVVHGASGGCVTAVTLARQLIAQHHSVLAMVADCGIPGSGGSIPSPVSVFRSRRDRYWNQHEKYLFSAWRTAGYTVEFEANANAQHAWVVDRKCIRLCLEYYEAQHGVRILE